jgi:hypothetical protein
LRQVFLWALPFVSSNDAFYNVFLSRDTRRLLKNPRMSRVRSLGQILVEGRRSIP